MPISNDDFNSGMDLMVKTFRAKHDADLEAAYYDLVKGWSLPVWRHVVTALVNTHKFPTLPLPSQLDEVRRQYRPDTAPVYVPQGTPLYAVTIEARQRFFSYQNRRWDGEKVEFSVTEKDFPYRENWLRLLERHCLDPNTTEFTPALCDCYWCHEHDRGIYTGTERVSQCNKAEKIEDKHHQYFIVRHPESVKDCKWKGSRCSSNYVEKVKVLP